MSALIISLMGKGPTDSGGSHGRWRCKCDDCRQWRSQREKARIEKLREQPIPADKHGTVGYTFWKCRCATCMTAQQAAQQRGKADRAARLDDAPHGTRTGYKDWSCRCRPCIDAWNAHQKRRLLPSRDQATNAGKQWTGPELEVASRADLPAREVARRLGRSISAVVVVRYALRRDPRKAELLGEARKQAPGHRLPVRGIR